jgi:hypothetical protein
MCCGGVKYVVVRRSLKKGFIPSIRAGLATKARRDRLVRSAAPDAKGSATMRFEDPDPSSPVIVELGQPVVDGVSIAEARMQPVPKAKSNGNETPGAGGVLRLDGLGAVGAV